MVLAMRNEKDVSVTNRDSDDLNNLRKKVINLLKETEESIKRNIISCKEFKDSIPMDLPYMRNTKESNLLDLVKNNKFIVLLGDAGEGKSIFLKRTAYEIMSKHNSSNNYLALYYSLNMYVDEDIQMLLEKEYGDFTKFKDLKLLFLFDEFDQVQNKALLIKKLQSFREKYCDSHFCIASRSNAYSNNFNNAELVQLLPFSFRDIEQFVKNKLPLKYKAFLQDAKIFNYMEFMKNPFNLNIIIDYYKINNSLPKNTAEIINEVIKSSINEKLNELEENILFKESYELEKVYFDLQKIALVMESIQSNFLTNKQLMTIIPNKETRHVIKNLSIIKKRFNNNNISFQFIHNNYNEYLAADALKNKSLDDILQLITIDGLPEFNILPSWKNTVAFLLYLRDNQDLIENLITIEPSMLLDLEVGRLTKPQRNQIFKTLYEKNSSRNILLGDNPSDLAKIAMNKETYNYLKDIIISSSNNMNTYNAVYTIRYFKEYAEINLKNALINLVLNIDINTGLRTGSLSTLTSLYPVDEELVQAVLPILQEKDNESLIGSFFSFLTKYPNMDNYIEIIIEHIPLLKFSLDSTIHLSNYNIYTCIEKLQSSKAIIKLLDYFIENTKTLGDIQIDDLIPSIVRKALIHQESSVVWNKMRELLRKVDIIYLHKALHAIHEFFVGSRTLNQLFDSFYNHPEIKKDHHYYKMIALSMTEESIQRLISDKKDNLISENEIMKVIFEMRGYHQKKDLVEKLIHDLNIKEPTPKNYEERQNKKLMEQIEIIFSKEKFLAEVKNIFKGEEKETLCFDDLNINKMWDDLKGDEKYNGFVLQRLREILKRKPITIDELETLISNYDLFTLNEAYNIKVNNSNAEFSKEQREKISQICYEKIKHVDFNNAITYQENSLTFGSIYVSLWFFQRSFNLQYPENILLDMISFDYFIKNNYVGIKYIEEYVSLSLMQQRILWNLINKDIREQILRNHLSFCKEYKVTDSIEIIKELLSNSNLSNRDRLECLKTLIHLGVEISYLKELMMSTEDEEIFDTCAAYLRQLEPQETQDILIENLDKKENIALKSAAHLINYQNIKGIEYYINYIRKQKKYVSFTSNMSIQQISNIEALELLFTLLNDVVRKEIKQEPFERLQEEIVSALKNIAVKDANSLGKVLEGILGFIDQNKEDIELNHFHAIHDDVMKFYKSNYKKSNDIYNALTSVNRILFVPEDEEYRNRLITCINLQTDIMEHTDTIDIFKLHPKNMGNIAYLVSLKLSKNNYEFENFINYMQQIFFESLHREQKQKKDIDGRIYKEHRTLFEILNVIRCLRHYYHHMELSDPNVVDTVNNFFLNFGGQPNTPEKWMLLHSRIIKDLEEALLKTNSTL